VTYIYFYTCRNSFSEKNLHPPIFSLKYYFFQKGSGHNLPRNTHKILFFLNLKKFITRFSTICAVQVGRRTEDNFPKLDNTLIQGLNFQPQRVQFQKHIKTPIFQLIRYILHQLNPKSKTTKRTNSQNRARNQH